jgi:hypothetical protein
MRRHSIRTWPHSINILLPILPTTSPPGLACVLLLLALEVMVKVMRTRQRRGFWIVPGRFRRTGVQERVRKVFRRRSDSPRPRRASTAAWVLIHTGTARASNFFPCGVNSSRRARWSSWFVLIFIRPRRCSGFRAALKVVRSIASNDATAPIAGASGRFKDIIRENCPLVRPSGRSALSKRRASVRAAR